MRFHAQRRPLGGTGGPLHGCRRSRGPRSWSQETRRARWRGFVRGVDMGGPGPTGRPYPTALECRAVDAPTGGGQGQARARARARAEGEAWPTPRTWRCFGRRGGEGCYDTCRSVLYREPRASPWPFRVTGVSYARARQRPGGLTVSPHARFGTASGGGRKCGEKRRGVGRRAAPRTAGHPSRGRDTCGSEG